MNRTKLVETLQNIRINCNTLESAIAGFASERTINEKVDHITQLIFQLDAARLEK